MAKIRKASQPPLKFYWYNSLRFPLELLILWLGVARPQTWALNGHLCRPHARIDSRQQKLFNKNELLVVSESAFHYLLSYFYRCISLGLMHKLCAAINCCSGDARTDLLVHCFVWAERTQYKSLFESWIFGCRRTNKSFLEIFFPLFRSSRCCGVGQAVTSSWNN